MVADSASQTPTSTKHTLRLSEIRRLSDPTEAAEQLILYSRDNAEKELSDLRLQRESALRNSLLRDSLILSTGDDGDPSVLTRNYINYARGFADDSHESAPGFDADLSDCFVDIEKARAAPDLQDTEPLSPEDLRPCWE